MPDEIEIISPRSRKGTAQSRTQTNVQGQSSSASAVLKRPATSAPHSAQKNTSKPVRNSQNPASSSSKGQPKRGTYKPSKKPTRKQKAEQKQRSKEELKAKIKTQSPSQRHAVRIEKKINGSVKNLEIKRRANPGKQKFRLKKKKNPLKRIMFLGLIIFLLIFGILFGLLAAYVSFSLKSGASATGEAYRLQIGAVAHEDENNITQMSAKVSQREGLLYIPVSALSEMCNLTVTGVSDDLRYIVRDNDSQIIRFIVGTNLAYVNSCKVRLSGDSFIDEGKLYVPLDFFIQYSEGLTIDVDNNEKLITIYRTVIDKDELLKDIHADFKFKLDALEPISEIPIPEDVYSEPQDTAEADRNDEAE